jgi:hypothetical protein
VAAAISNMEKVDFSIPSHRLLASHSSAPRSSDRF